MSGPLSQKENYTLTVEERLELLKRIDNLQYYDRMEDVIDLIPVEQQNSFFANFNLSFIDTISAFFRQIFFGESMRQYIFKKAIKNEINYLSHLNPPVLDKNGAFILASFLSFLFEAGKISFDYQEFFKFWKKIFSSKNNLVSFALYYFDKIKNNNGNSYFELFHEKQLIDLIKSDKDYIKTIAENISAIKKHIKNNLNKFLDQLNQLYNLIIFFTYDFSNLFKLLYPIHFNDFSTDFFENQFPNVNLDKFTNAIRTISRLFMVYPYYNEFSEENLNCFFDYYDEVFPQMNIEKKVFFPKLVKFSERIQYYAAKDIVNRLYRILYKNPLLKVPFYSINLDLKTSFEKQIELSLEEKVKDAQQKVEQQLFNEFYALLKEEGADKIKPNDANDSLILLISKFELSPLNYIKSYLIFYSFFKSIWLGKIYTKIMHLIEFKYFIFNQNDIKVIKEVLESLNQILVDFDLVDKLANGIKIEMMKFDKKLPVKEDYLKLSLLTSNLDSKMKQVLVNGITGLVKLKNNFNIDNTDAELVMIDSQLSKYIEIFQRICPYDR